MSSSTTNQYIREVLHHMGAPPPIKARFFYTSPIPIDDPLSPLPPPATANSASVRQVPKPFAAYDNTALDKAWNELRLKILKYNEVRGEKAASHEESQTRARTDSSLVRDGHRGSPSKPATPRSKPARQAASNLSQVDGSSDVDELEQVDGSGNADTAVPTDTTGTPFIRAPSRKKVPTSTLNPPDDRIARPKIRAHDTYQWDDPSHLAEHSPAPAAPKAQDDSPSAKVAVGASRLHQVEMPSLEMTPIYWAPVHDTAQVVRGTWFYQDTMLPVETAVANMLEAGYIDLQVWTETWKDELDSAAEVGAEGEMKIVHRLWPDKPPKPVGSRPSSQMGTGTGESLLRAATANVLFETEPETVGQQRERAVEVACDIIDVSIGSASFDNKASGNQAYGRQGTVNFYATSGVIYATDREATILKPALLPSSYYGRRPLANYIRKGHKIGIPVVRGFDQAIWDKLHPSSKKSTKEHRAEHGLATSASGVAPEDRRMRDAELAKSEHPRVTDLVLVIHGIGQKLSQRMESFHFTHAINAFRREIMVECGNAEVRTHFRNGMGGIMALPVNWRHSLSFEEGGYRPDGSAQENDNAPNNEFTLEDITPDTLPSVRGIVSDVMLDIPYYMSHHQPKMIAAVIKEANRVYKLWCANNPSFAEHGRVHIIGHSLGSVMSIDVLSRQPTVIPKHLKDPTQVDLDSEHLDHLIFNTHNLFLVGSPAGFFILLRKAQLRPRIDYPSAQAIADPTSNTTTICGKQGDYGCIAVHNIYNIINGYDPVAYRVNAAVDATYAAALRKFFIPSSTPSYWFAKGASGKTRWFSGGPTQGRTTAAPAAPLIQRLPSNVELETHNFTQEEIAEKKMALLNDNGQVDYFVKYGGGAFEIQYLTMLGAHSSYWGLRDFIRMVVMEVGRADGKEGALNGLRAVKKKTQLAAK